MSVFVTAQGTNTEGKTMEDEILSNIAFRLRINAQEVGWEENHRAKRRKSTKTAIQEGKFQYIFNRMK